MAVLLAQKTNTTFCKKVEAVLEPSDKLSLTVHTADDKTLTAILDLKTDTALNTGTYIYIDLFDSSIKTVEWGDIPIANPILGIVFNFSDEIYVCLYTTELDPILSANVVPNIVEDVIEYIKQTSNSYKLRRQLLEYKEVHVKNRLPLHASVTSNETQVDFLTEIIRELVKGNPELETKYGSLLESLKAVGTETVKPFDIPKLVEEKKKVRDVQIEYFDYRNALH